MLFAFWAVGPSWLPSAPTGAPQTHRASRASRSSAARALAKSAAEPSADHAEPCNVVLTHTNTDFDSLAAAVALARLWSYQRPEVPTHVVMPRGVNPLVARFLAYHKHLLPVRGLSTINPSDLRAVGVVDTQTRERLGPAARWLDCASYVAVYDHHVDNTPNIQHDELVIEPVGSATTVLVERLRALFDAVGGAAGGGVGGAAGGEGAGCGEGGEGQEGAPLPLSEAEATLFALGIRADTGALSYPDTTARDGHALVWLMEAGASQHAIAEFGHARLSAAQRDVLSTALAQTERSVHEGLQVGRVLLDSGKEFMAGMAAVAEELLQLMGLDVVLLAATHENSKQQVYLSLIGRASARAKPVDLNALMRRWEGGGHRAAAAASTRLGATGDEARTEAEAVLLEAHAVVVGQIPQQVTAADLMTSEVFSCSPDDTMEDARGLMLRVQRKAAPVVDESGKFLGMLKYRDVMKAAQASKGGQRVKSWVRRDTLTVPTQTPLHELEAILIEQSAGRLPVVADDGTLVGLVTRTDVLRQRNLYTTEGLERSRASLSPPRGAGTAAGSGHAS